MNNRFSRIVCGFLSVVMCICSTVHVARVSAEDVTDTVPEVTDAITAKALSVVLERSDGSYAEINEYTEVKTGDTISLDFAWETINDNENFPPVTFVYDLSSQLQNIKLDNTTITTADATYRIVDQVLYIDIEKGKSGRSGTCQLSGTVDLSNAQVDNEGVTTIEFLDKTLKAKVPEKVTGVLVEKSAGEFAEEGDAYYQYFTVKVTNKSAQNAVTGATLTDSFVNSDNLFDGTALENYTITNPDGTVNSTYNNTTVEAGTAITLPDMAAGEYVTVSYKVKVDKAAALNQKDGTNLATVAYKNGENDATATGRATANPDIPAVSKSGVLDSGKENVTYTITVDPGTMVADDENFVVLDTPEGLDPQLIADKISGSSVVDGSVSIPLSAMGAPDANGVYTLTYTIALPDSYKNQIVNKTVSNEISVTFDDTYTYKDTESIYIPASGTALVTKTVDSYDYDTGVINWKVELFIPNDDSETNKLISYVYSDWLNGHVDGAQGTQGNSYFDDNGATDSAEKAAAVISGIKIDGQPIDDTIATYDIWNTHSTNVGSLTFTEEFLDNHAGQTVTLTYSSTMDTSVEGYNSLVYTNSSKVNFTFEDNEYNERQSHAFVSPDIYSTKKVTTASTTDNNAVKWSIILKSLKYDFSADGTETITVTDTLPEGYRLIDGSYGIAAENWEAESWNDAYKSLVSYTASVNEATDIQTVTFTVTVDDTLKSLLNRSGENRYLSVVFEAAMTDDYYEEFNLSHNTGESVDVTNNAAIELGGNEYDVSSTHQVTPVLPDSVLSKSILSEGKVLDSDGDETNTFEAQYQIVVNENAEDLIAGSDELVLTDTLGTWLELDEGSIAVSPAVDSSAISYDKSSRTITLKLEDNKKYTITYDVTGDCAKFKQIDSAESGIDPDYADEMFSNTVSFKGSGDTVLSDSIQLSEGTYKTSATYQYDVVLLGEKTWLEAEHAALIPKSVIIKVKTTKTTPAGDTEVYYEEQEHKVEAVDGKWKYEITGLSSMDSDGNRYEYEIEEVMVGGDLIGDSGYTVVYEDAGSSDNEGSEEHSINFTNTFTADRTEVGSLSITKSWTHDGNTSAPADSVNVKIYAVGVQDPVKEGIVTSGTALEFTDLPLYDYSRDADDKLVRTLRKYYVVETAVDGYTTTYSVNGNTAVDSCAEFTLSADSKAAVAITNTYNTSAADQKYGSVKVTKVWNDTANTENIAHPDSITVTLKADGAVHSTKTISGAAATAEFTNLPVYKTENGLVTAEKIKYTVEETAVDGYTTAYSVSEIELTDGVQSEVTVTNTFNVTFEEGSISVTKNWTDASGAAIASQGDVTVTLNDSLGSTPVSKTISGSTAAVFENLPVYSYSRAADGSLTKTAVTYTVTETAVDGYTASYTVDGAALTGGITLTDGATTNVVVTNKKNAADQKYGSVKVTKVWNDTANTENIAHPDSITVTLKADGAVHSTKTISGGAATAEFTNLPVYKTENGLVTAEKIKYTVEETAVDGYTTAYSVSEIELTDGVQSEVTVTNTFAFIEELGSISVAKGWQNSDGNAISAPSDVTVILSNSANNTEKSKDITVGNTSVMFDNLPIYESYERDASGSIVGKNPITYYVTEVAVDGYEATYSVSPAVGLTLVSNAAGSVQIVNKAKAQETESSTSETTAPSQSSSETSPSQSSSATSPSQSSSATSPSQSSSATSPSQSSSVTSPSQSSSATSPSQSSSATSPSQSSSATSPSQSSSATSPSQSSSATSPSQSSSATSPSQSSSATSPSQSSSATSPSQSSSATSPSQSSSATSPSQSSSATSPSQSSSATSPSQSSSATSPSQSSSATSPSQSSSATSPSYTTPSRPVGTTTTVKNTTTTQAPAETEAESTTEATTTETAETEVQPDNTTVIEEDTDTTSPAETEEELSNEDAMIDDSIGSDSEFTTEIEENPHTSITINFGYFLSFAFGTYAFFPRKKKK